MYWILLVFLFISMACNLVVVSSQLALGDNYHGAPFILTAVLTLLIFALVLLFRRGFRKIINNIFLLFLLFIYSDIVYKSKPENEFAVFIMVIYVIVAAIILKGKPFFASVGLLFTSFLILSYLKINEAIPAGQETNFANVAGIAVMMTMIVFISWLFNSEINNYINQLKNSKQMLQRERDLLEVKVLERTKQLQKEQVDKLAEFSKFAEFGRLAQGLFHDLMNPLTALSLNLSQIKTGNDKDIDKLNDYIDGAKAAASNIDKLILSTRNYFQHKVEKTSFSIVDELNCLKQIVKFKAEKAGVKLIFQESNDSTIYGNKTRFSQLIANLVLNAIEAYDQTKGKNEKEVVLKFGENKNRVVITVSDRACGMSSSVLQKIFKPFFSTKDAKGNIGIGLSMCKDIVEAEFMGKIEVESKVDEGTEFRITLPLLPLP